MELMFDSSPLLKERIRRAAIFLLVAIKQLKGDGQASFVFDRFGTADELHSRTGFLYLFIDDEQRIDCLANRSRSDHHPKKSRS